MNAVDPNAAPMSQAQIFISYRRDDTAGYARAVYDELARHFGPERVFIDVDDIGAGQAFDEVIARAVGGSKVLLVMIGKRWLGEREGRPARIAEPDDFVRLEVAAALAQRMRVIPLLLDGAAMPVASQLPESLQPLVRRNALAIDNTRFASDMARLVAALREALGEPTDASKNAPASGFANEPEAAAPPAGSRAWLGWSVAAGLLLAGLLALWWPQRAPPPTGANVAPGPLTAGGSGATLSAAAARPDLNGEWQAEVTYDWPNARYTERFVFGGEGSELHGSASFLGVARGVLEGSAVPDGVRFLTRTKESAAGASAETVHRYRGRLQGEELRFVMQTEGGETAHVPVEFVARRVAPAVSTTSR